MKRKIVYIMLSAILACCLIFAAACRKDGEKGAFTISEAQASIAAELGEMCDIPVITATADGASVDVVVKVTDKDASEVPLLGRGTRFEALSIDGYTITYTAQHGKETLTRTTSVVVSDTKGPIITPSVNTLIIDKNSMVQVPEATFSDASGEIKTTDYSVSFNDTVLTLTQTDGKDYFAADEYGTYKITYTATDKYDNQSKKILEAHCVRSVTLCDFENDQNVWAPNMEFVPYGDSENTLKVTTVGADYFATLAIYPPYYDLSGFDMLQITVYADREMDTGNEGLYLLNHKFTLREGKNVIIIDKEILDSQYPGSVIPSSLPNYSSYMYLWFQIVADPGIFHFDSLIGVFNNYETDTKLPVIDFGKEIKGRVITVEEQQLVIVPNAYVYDNSMEELTYTYTVTDNDGDDITQEVTAGTFRAKDAGDVYTITYKAQDSAGNKSEKTLSINVRESVVLPDPDPSETNLPDDREYDMLQDFETGLNSSVAVWPLALAGEDAHSERHAVQGKSIRIGWTNAQDGRVNIMLKKDGAFLMMQDIMEYEYFQLTVFSYTDTAVFYIFKHGFELEQGRNIIVITQAELLEQLSLDTSGEMYKNGWLWCQTASHGSVDYMLFLDNFIGVYPEGYERPAEERETDVLQDFEQGLNISVKSGALNDHISLTADNAVSGNAIKIGPTTHQWAQLDIAIRKDGNLLTQADLALYDYFEITVYSEDADARFALYNQLYDLLPGKNIIRITSAQMLEQLSEASYSGGWLYFQTASHGGVEYTIYIDNFIGVYPEGYERPVDTERQTDILQNFETVDSVEFSVEGAAMLSADNPYDKTLVKIGPTSAQWTRLNVLLLKDGEALTLEEFKAYDYFELTVYSESAGAVLWLYNQRFDLVEGVNNIRITGTDMAAQINEDSYSQDGWLWCQINSVDAVSYTLYFESFTGVYTAE